MSWDGLISIVLPPFKPFLCIALLLPGNFVGKQYAATLRQIVQLALGCEILNPDRLFAAHRREVTAS
jgi:hypothetical protein